MTKTKRRRSYAEPSDLTPTERHTRALKQEQERLRRLTPVEWRRLTATFPELDQLRSALADLMDLSDPARGRVIDGPGRRGAYDPIAPDGRSTTEGRPTLPTREQLDYIRREIRRLTLRVMDSANPEARALAKKMAGRKPRCRRAECDWRDRSQNWGTEHCGKCGHPIRSSGQ